jgi:hypothetical protein
MIETDLELVQTERPRFYEQQYLGADDLSATVDYARIARARHDLGAHVWGIASGLQVIEKSSSSGVDVYVQPGYAWDGIGRPITLLTAYKIPADLFKTIVYDAATDNTATPGRLVRLWLQYTESPVGGPQNGFQTCSTDDQSSRVVESFQIVIGDQPAPTDRHDKIDVAGKMTDPDKPLQSLGSATDPLVTDESIPYQTFPSDWGGARWLVPLGVVRWLPNTNANQAGSFQSRTADDLVVSERQRRYIGVVAETINAARGYIRLRTRDADYSPAVWSDDLVWCEGDLRVSGDMKLLAGKVILRDQNNDDNGTPLAIKRTETNALSPAGRDMFVQIGAAQGGANRLVVGPVLTSGDTSTPQEVFVVRDNGTVGIGTSEPTLPLSIRGQGTNEELIAFESVDGTKKWHFNQNYNGQSGFNIAESNVADGRLYIQAGGNVGVNTTAPTHRLHVNGNTGIRQNRLYMSGGDGNDNWSSISFNAYHRDDNGAWTFPDNSRKAVTIEMDDKGGTPRFEVYSTTSSAPTSWTQRLAINGNTGDVALAHHGGNVGIGLTDGLCRLHVAGVQSGSASTITSHVALIENAAFSSNADVLALRVGSLAATTGNNFITFFTEVSAIGSIEGHSGGITLNTSSADYAEWLPRRDPKQRMNPGDVVGLFAGKIAYDTEGADCVLPISTTPVILGNRPPDDQASTYEKVAMLGQVPVNVRGKANVGDFIVGISGDGTGTAIAPEDMTFDDYARVLGVAWEANTTSGVQAIRVGIGLPASAVWRAVQRELATLHQHHDTATHKREKTNA